MEFTIYAMNAEPPRVEAIDEMICHAYVAELLGQGPEGDEDMEYDYREALRGLLIVRGQVSHEETIEDAGDFHFKEYVRLGGDPEGYRFDFPWNLRWPKSLLLTLARIDRGHDKQVAREFKQLATERLAT